MQNLNQPGTYELFGNQFHLIIRDTSLCKIDHRPLSRKCEDWRYLIILAEPQWRELDPSVEIPFICKKVDVLECGCAFQFTNDEWNFFAPNMRFYIWDKEYEANTTNRKRTPIGEAVRRNNICPIPASLSRWADKVEFRRVENHWEYRYAWIRNAIPVERDLMRFLNELHERILLPYERIYTARSIMKLTSTLQNILLFNFLELIATYV